MIPYRALLILFPLLLCHVLGQQRRIPHITRANGDFQSHLILANKNSRAAELTLLAYDAAGNVTATALLKLETGATQVRTLSSLFGDVEVAHVTLQGDGGVTVAAAYQSLAGGCRPMYRSRRSRQVGGVSTRVTSR